MTKAFQVNYSDTLSETGENEEIQLYFEFSTMWLFIFPILNWPAHLMKLDSNLSKLILFKEI